MTPERWQQIRDVLGKALELAPGQRSAYLNQACSSHPSLRQEVETLLASSDDVLSSFLQSSTLRVTLTSGTKLGDYEVKSLLGSGGMGEVYRARDSRLGRDVAIKVLPSFLSADSDRLRRFEQEARAAAALNHPNILAVFQMGTYEGAPYLVSELLEGETLREQIKRGHLFLRKAIDYGVQIARGLAAAHEKGIVHRDLKPENLFVTKDGRVKILDFGLAKLSQPQSSSEHSALTLTEGTEPGVVMGTVGYMSPEQVRGQTADHRADVFAFGAILYEMLAEKRAFQKPTSPETMTAILNEDPPGISQITANIPPALQRVVRRCLEKNPEQRFQSASDLAFALDALSESGGSAYSAMAAKGATGAGRRWKAIVPAAVAVLALSVGGYFYFHRRPKLTYQDTIVLADFANTTGEGVFDDTLKQALSVELAQSPFLNVLPEQRVQETLRLMGRAGNERVTQSVAREVCQRTQSRAVLVGSIASLGSHYVIGLNAQNCFTGGSLAQEEVEASRKEDILKMLGQATTKVREELGETLPSVHKFDVPIEQATTLSFDALKAYSLGQKLRAEKGDVEAIPMFKRAIELDPSFALAYGALGRAYQNRRETELAAANIQKAFELRDRVSARERLRISAYYYSVVEEGDEKALEAHVLWAQEYPQDELAHRGLANTYVGLGQYEKSVAENREELRLNPNDLLGYYNLINSYISLNRLDEAKAEYQQALGHHLEDSDLHHLRYKVAFLENDTAEMERQLAWGEGKPGVEAEFLDMAATTEKYKGRLNKARELTRRSVDSALRNDE
jgi:tetratricopeptide (TPR) repeat protein